jgi:hypothetical protein
MSDERAQLEELRRLRELEAKAAAPDFAKQAAGMDPMDLSIARSKNDDFGEYLRAQAAKPKDGETPDQTFKRQYGGLPNPKAGIAEGSLRSGLQGVTAGAGDELTAAIGATLDPVRQGDTGTTWGDRYDAYVARERGKLDQFRKDHPVIATGAEIGGAVANPLTYYGPAAATTLGGRVAAGAGVAGGQGFVYGFNSGRDSLENRLAEGVKTGLIAAPIGAAAPLVGAGARAAWNRYFTGRAAEQAGMSRPAYETLTRAMDADGSLRGPGAQRLAAAGNQAMLADAGPNAMTLLDTAVQRSGPASTIARNAIDERVTQAAQGITNTLDNTLGAPQGINETARGIAQSTVQSRGDAYRAAYDSAIDYASQQGRRIEEVLNRVPRGTLERAIQEANDEMVSMGQRNRQIMASIAGDGTVTFREMPNVQQLDEIKKALQRIGRESLDQYGRQTGAGLRANRLATDLRQAIGDAAPAYNDATRLGGDKIAMDQALDLGRRLLSPGTTREVVRDAVDGMSQAERGMVAQGVRAQIDEALANVKMAMTDRNMDAREAVKALRDFSSRAVREKVSAAIGDTPAAQMFDELDRAAMAFELRAGVATNSRTFARTSMDDLVNRQVNTGVINALRSGEGINATKQGVQLLAGRTEAAKQRLSDQAYSDIARTLTGPRGPAAVSLLQNLEQSQSLIPQMADQAGSRAEMLARPPVLSAPIYESNQDRLPWWVGGHR